MLEALIVEFYIKPEFIDDFAVAIQKNALASLTQEPGCHHFDVCRDPADPSLFFLYELYKDEAAIQLHMASAHFLAFSQLTNDWVSRKSVRKMQRATTGMSVAAMPERRPTCP
jgi:quinol monooxygenase YgiN